MHALAHIDHLQVVAKLPATDAGTKANDLAISNVGSLVFAIENGVAKVRSFHLGGEDTGIAVLGSIPCSAHKPMHLTVGGSAGLRIFELFDSRVRASGQSLVAASIRGPLSDPVVDGTLEIKNGSFFLDGVPNGLTAVNGKVSFDRSRATIDKLTAESGGGKLNLGGFVSFAGGPLVYNLQASAQNVRVRPAPSMSITGNGSLRLSGTSDNSILGGTVSVSHIVLSPNSDWEGLLVSASAPVPTPGNAKNFITGLQFDVHIVSAPNLQLSSSLGRDLQTQVDLQLRGTPSQPVLLGTVSANQGELKIFGAKYTINHADIHFTSPVEIEPAVDLDLQTQAHGITVNITVTGTLNKLNINYRSDPPLQPRDIIALLAVGETPGTAAHVANTPTAAETAALESSANTVLG
ncbi:MAG: translocation/assembly module TamB domain-containing protein, partial [Bryobacteraceae bacterium]